MRERLLLFLEYLKLGQHKFAKSVGLSVGFINNMGDNISSKSMNKILSTYPQLNEKWLLTGEGEMLNANVNIAQSIKGDNTGINSSIGGDVTISHNDFSNMLELQKGYQTINKELNERLKASQNQIDTLLEIIKNK